MKAESWLIVWVDRSWVFSLRSASGSFVTQTFKSLSWFKIHSAKRFELENVFTFIFVWGEGCQTYNGFAGVCTELPNCATLVQLYRTNPSQQTVDILIASQRNCGNRKVGRNPLMCCSDGVPQTTTPPPQQPPAPLGNLCSTPDGINGYCTGKIDNIVWTWHVFKR